MTNIDEVFQFLTAQGQSPRLRGDAYITLELMGHRLDREVERLFDEATEKGLEGLDLTRYIDDHICMANVLKTTMSHYDGGYVMCGLTGSGEMFAVRDPWGIRPAFYYRDEEMVVLASERPVLQTTFNLEASDVCELLPGQALIVRKNGESLLEQILRFQEAVRLYGPFETDTGRVLSLSCLSLDTVYCSMKGRKLEHISILPLRCLPGSYDYPAELPREAGRRSCSEKTDVYAAACIAAEIANWTPDGVRMKSLPSSCAGLLTECLSPFPELRPAAASVLDALRAPEESGAVSVPSGSSWLQSLRQGVNKIAGAARDAMNADPDAEEPGENRRRSRPERDEDQ